MEYIQSELNLINAYRNQDVIQNRNSEMIKSEIRCLEFILDTRKDGILEIQQAMYSEYVKGNIEAALSIMETKNTKGKKIKIIARDALLDKLLRLKMDVMK